MTVDLSRGAASAPGTSSHQAAIADQFSRQAELFAAAPALHNQAALDLLVEAAEPRPGRARSMSPAVPAPWLRRSPGAVRQAAGLDATEAMLAQARKLAARSAVAECRVASEVMFTRCRLPTARSISSAAGSRSITSRNPFAHSGKWCGCAVRAGASCCAMPLRRTMRTRRTRSIAWNGTAIPSTVEFRPLAFLSGLFAARRCRLRAVALLPGAGRAGRADRHVVSGRATIARCSGP